jgi:hypothetical protein
MNTSIASPAPAAGQGSVLFFISLVMFLWGGLVLTLAANGLMMVAPGQPPRGFVLFHLAGLFDFVVAVGSGSLVSITGSGLLSGEMAGTASMAPMNALPLVMIPGFLVPIFIILHLIALIQSNHARKEAGK